MRLFRIIYGVVLIAAAVIIAPRLLKADPVAVDLTGRPFTPVEIVYNQYLPMRADLILRGVSAPETLVAGTPLVFALRWDVRYTPGFELSVVYSLTRPADGLAFAAKFDKIAPDYWITVGTITRHTLDIPVEVPAGTYTITVNARIRDGDLGSHVVGSVQVVGANSP